MRPLEFVKLPNELNNVDTYIDGERCHFTRMPYVKNSIMYFPYQEMCYKMQIIKTYGNDDYVTANFMSEKHSLTLAWEEATKTIYVCSVPHYDGYMEIPEECITDPQNSKNDVNLFMFLDGRIEDICGNSVITVKKDDCKEIIHFSGRSTVPLRKGNYYRFCFQYKGADSNGVASGYLMETTDSLSQNAIGNMWYKDSDWSEMIQEHPELNASFDMSTPEGKFKKHLYDAEKGKGAESYYLVGHDYQHGDGTSVDYKKAGYWYEKAIALDHVAATCNLGFLYVCGLGYAKNYEKGIALYKTAARGGDKIAMNNLGKLYRDGEGVAKDPNQAKEYFLMASELGDGGADYLIGDLYERGALDDDNHKNALFWFNKSAEKGFDIGQMALAEMYHEGKGIYRDKRKALELYEKAARQGGKAMSASCVRMGEIYSAYPYNDYIEAEIWFKKAAEHGEAPAQFVLGTLYCDVDIMKNETKAKEWLGKAAEQGYPDAIKKLREMGY